MIVRVTDGRLKDLVLRVEEMNHYWGPGAKSGLTYVVRDPGRRVRNKVELTADQF